MGTIILETFGAQRPSEALMVAAARATTVALKDRSFVSRIDKWSTVCNMAWSDCPTLSRM